MKHDHDSNNNHILMLLADSRILQTCLLASNYPLILSFFLRYSFNQKNQAVFNLICHSIIILAGIIIATIYLCFL